MAKRTVLLLFGGESSEHEVSIISARNVAAALDPEKYDVKYGYITRSGTWQLVDSIDARDTHRTLSPLLSGGAFDVSDGSAFDVDVIFPVLHGAHGEDGDVQGLARLMHIPCVGPSVIGAAVSMDKDMTKRLLRDARIPVVDWMTHHISEPAPSYDQARHELGNVMFVKPANAGSSVGVSKVRTAEEFASALVSAHEHDDFILIEKAIIGSEMQTAVLGNDNPQVTDICEIIIGADFHDFEDKYSETSAAQFYIPARISDDTTTLIKDYALSAYRAVRGHGMARIDFFLAEDGRVYLNEINSIPGFTNVSIYPRLWREAGKNASQLVDELIQLAIKE